MSGSRTVWVLPSIDPAYRRECEATMSVGVRDRLLVVDNSVVNAGVAAVWNQGIAAAAAEGADWLVLVSESMRFGPAGGEDFEAALVGEWTDSYFGWHLVGFARATWERVGTFDENFFAYMEDSDYLVRLHLAGLASPRLNDRPHTWVTTDGHHMGTEHSIRAGLVRYDGPRLLTYWMAKWGADHPGYHFDHPFGNPTLDWTYWPERALAR